MSEQERERESEREREREKGREAARLCQRTRAVCMCVCVQYVCMCAWICKSIVTVKCVHKVKDFNFFFLQNTKKGGTPLNLESEQAQAVGGEDKWCGAGAAPIGPQRSISSDELARMAPLGSGTPKSQCSSTHCAATDGASDEQD